MKAFLRLLANSLVASVTTSFLWFALTFWAYLETRSVLATSIIGGSFMLLASLSGMVFGTFVDRHKKHTVMVLSNLITLGSFALAALLFLLWPTESLLDLSGWRFWSFVLIILCGSVFGGMRMIALSTCVTLLVPEEEHDRANGLIGIVNGISFAVTSVFSGLVVGQLGMGWALILSLGLTGLVTLDLFAFRLDETAPVGTYGRSEPLVDIRGSLNAIRGVPGLLALIFFATFNNFLGGVFMSLIDPYGLSLVTVEAWGFIWGALSFGFILGGIIVSRRGLGSSPLRTLFLANMAMWLITILFPVRSSIVLLIIGFFIYMCLIPSVEAAEQTVIQKVVPFDFQGRVFGFAQAVESAASPFTAFLIGPIAELWIIPYMTTGRGAVTIGPWFGTGPDRGMAMIFMLAGIIGLAATVLAMRSRAYRLLTREYAR